MSKEENFKWHLEAFASELFIYVYIRIYGGNLKEVFLPDLNHTN